MYYTHTYTYLYKYTRGQAPDPRGPDARAAGVALCEPRGHSYLYTHSYDIYIYI